MCSVYGNMRNKKTYLKYHFYIIFLCFCGQHSVMKLALVSSSFTERLVKKGKDWQGATQSCSWLIRKEISPMPWLRSTWDETVLPVFTGNAAKFRPLYLLWHHTSGRERRVTKTLGRCLLHDDNAHLPEESGSSCRRNNSYTVILGALTFWTILRVTFLIKIW